MSSTSTDSNLAAFFLSATAASGWSTSHQHPFLIIISGLAAARQVLRPAVGVGACREGGELLLLPCGNRCAFPAAHLCCSVSGVVYFVTVT